MNQFVLFVISVGFGSLAWMMLVLSDWLLGDKPARPAAHRIYLPPIDRLKIGRSFANTTSPRGIVPTARKAS
jgi:hypothetical protein